MLGLVVLVSIASGTAWLLSQMEQERAATVSAHLEQQPDYTMENVLSTERDAQGRMKSLVQARSLAHYEQRGTDLDTPYLVWYENGEPSWYVRAERGHLSEDGNTIQLQGQTWIWQHDLSRQRWLTLESRDMTVQPQQGYAETAAPALLRLPGGQVRSVGLRAHLHQQHIEFLSKVEAYYANKAVDSR